MIAFQYKLYSNAKRGALDAQIDAFGELQNYIIRFCRKYYKLYKKPVDSNALSRHITKVKRTSQKWIADLPSQAVQDVIQRVFRAFKLFGIARRGKRKASIPHTKKPNSYKSFTLKQCGYGINGNKVRIGKHIYGFHLSRPILGKIKTLTVKRDATGDLWIIVVTDYVRPKMNTAKSGKSVGCDFGMKTFLTLSDGTRIEAPLFLKQAAEKHKKISRLVSSKKHRSKNRTKAKQTKARVERHIFERRLM